MAKSTARNKMGRTKLIALLALMLALTIIFCFVPIQFGPITLALMILPTLILAQVCDFKISLFMGLMMGLINYIAWFTTKPQAPLHLSSKILWCAFCLECSSQWWHIGHV